MNMERLTKHSLRRNSVKIPFSVVTLLVLSTISLIQITEAARHKSSSKNQSTTSTMDPNIQTPFPLPSIPTGAPTNYTKSGKTKAKGRSSSKRGSRESLAQASGLKANMGKSSQVKQSWLAVENALASETNQQLPINDDSKPTKYHYYPHNQHLYLLPECATQQVCSAVYLRLNYSQPLCACPNFHRPCSVSTRTDDRHTIPLVTGAHSQVLTLVKTCEPTDEVRECRTPKDWSILALQNSRTGKAHYLVICRCPSPGYLEGPIAHSQPAYARVPGIRVYGMTCFQPPKRTGREFAWTQSTTTLPVTKVEVSRGPAPKFPWKGIKSLLKTAGLIS